MKAAIVLETYRDGVTVADVARRHEISAPQVHAWRRAARDGLLPMPDDDALAFLPVSVSAGAGDPPRDGSGTVTLEIGAVRIIVPPAFDPAHLAQVIAVVRGTP